MGRLSATDRKGKLVEQIAAWMYEATDVDVQTRVFLPTLDGEERREIDVLLTDTRGIYPVRFAIECKNEGKPIDVKRIGEFIDKLNEVGIPLQHGVYVSVSRYTRDALRRAKKTGIRPLVLSNLTKDRLASVLVDAFQSLVFIGARVEAVNWVDGSATAVTRPEEYMLYDAEGQPVGTFRDYAWQWWVNLTAPPRIGTRIVELKFPADWYRLDGAMKLPLQHVAVTFSITGMVFTFRGRGRRHALTNALAGTLDRFREENNFPQPPLGQHVLHTFTAEEDLHNYVADLGATHIMSLIPLPRIEWGSTYWPPSERVARLLQQHMAAESAEESRLAAPLNFEEIEGTDVNVAWEPIWTGYFAKMEETDGEPKGGQTE